MNIYKKRTKITLSTEELGTINQCLRHIRLRLMCKAKIGEIGKLGPLKNLNWRSDFMLILSGFRDKRSVYRAFFRRNISKILADHLSFQPSSPPSIILSNYINPTLGQSLINHKQQFADSYGNMYLTPWRESTSLVLKHRPVNSYHMTERHGGIHHFAGAKVLYCILSHIKDRLTVRKLSSAADVSLAKGSTVLNILKDQGKISIHNKYIKLHKGTDIFESWVTSYQSYVRQKLSIGRYHLPPKSHKAFLQSLSQLTRDLKVGFAVTGDYAADYYTQSLFGGDLVCFVQRDAIEEICKKLKLIPTNEPGGIEFMGLFSPWIIENQSDHGVNYAHPIIVYPELLTTASSRAREVANKLYEREIRKILD